MKLSWLYWLASGMLGRKLKPGGSIKLFTLLSHTAAGSTNASSVTTGAIDTTGADLLIIAIGNVGGDATPPTDSNGNSYTRAIVSDRGNGHGQSAIWYCANPINGAGHTFTSVSVAPAIAVAAFRGGSLNNPLDQTNSKVEAAAVMTIAPGTVVPTQKSEVMVTAVTMNGTMTINGGPWGGVWTITDQIDIVGGQHFGVALAYLIEGNNIQTTQGPTWTVGGVSIMAACIATVKPGS